jgi:hypothetical protein
MFIQKAALNNLIIHWKIGPASVAATAKSNRQYSLSGEVISSEL